MCVVLGGKRVGAFFGFVRFGIWTVEFRGGGKWLVRGGCRWVDGRKGEKMKDDKGKRSNLERVDYRLNARLAMVLRNLIFAL